MSADKTPSAPGRKRLPVKPSLENLRKQAKRLAKQRDLTLAKAQHALAREYGCRNWSQLAHMVETMLRGADQLTFVKYEREPLVQAAQDRDKEKMLEILAAGEFTQHDLDLSLARCAMFFFDDPAVVARNRELAELLLEHGADPDGQYGSDYGPIVLCTGECIDPDALQFYIDAGADVAFAPVASKYGPASVMGHLLNAYVRGRNPQKHRMIRLLLDHGAIVPPEYTPPVFAIHRGDAAALAALLDADPGLLSRPLPEDSPSYNMDLRGATLLHVAVEQGELECIDLLVARGGDLNARSLTYGGIGGQTPVFHAVSTNCDGNFYTLEHRGNTPSASIGRFARPGGLTARTSPCPGRRWNARRITRARMTR
jgi:ankyrin repeat protein